MKDAHPSRTKQEAWEGLERWPEVEHDEAAEKCRVCGTDEAGGSKGELLECEKVRLLVAFPLLFLSRSVSSDEALLMHGARPLRSAKRRITSSVSVSVHFLTVHFPPSSLPLPHPHRNLSLLCLR